MHSLLLRDISDYLEDFCVGPIQYPGNQEKLKEKWIIYCKYSINNNSVTDLGKIMRNAKHYNTHA